MKISNPINNLTIDCWSFKIKRSVPFSSHSLFQCIKTHHFQFVLKGCYAMISEGAARRNAYENNESGLHVKLNLY